MMGSDPTMKAFNCTGHEVHDESTKGTANFLMSFVVTVVLSL